MLIVDKSQKVNNAPVTNIVNQQSNMSSANVIGSGGSGSAGSVYPGSQ
jgi:hypothetical protein